jgi:hypothetical protein
MAGRARHRFFFSLPSFACSFGDNLGAEKGKKKLRVGVVCSSGVIFLERDGGLQVNR